MTRILLAALFLAAGSHVAAADLRGTVVGVTDGDTLTVLDGSHKQHKIRLTGIDAPEKRQPYGELSKQHLSALVFKKEATLDCFKVDQYKRHVCRVWVDGKDVALAQVGAGLAWHFKRFENEQTPDERVAYAQAENDARTSRTGLWQQQRPVPPWEFRRQTK